MIIINALEHVMRVNADRVMVTRMLLVDVVRSQGIYHVKHLLNMMVSFKE